MESNHHLLQQVALELNIALHQLKATWALLESGATVPFISRYRKELTGGLDEVQIANIKEKTQQALELQKRKEFILKTIQELGSLTDPLQSKINKATTLGELEDLYLPYKPKRKTKASIAKEKGLEPLANLIFEQSSKVPALKLAAQYVNAAKQVSTPQEALEGALHIISEGINEDAQVRRQVRNLFQRTAQLQSKVAKGKEEAGQKFKDYFEWEESLSKIPSHRLLALLRGEKEKYLKLNITVDQDKSTALIESLVIRTPTYRAELKTAIQDAFKRLIKPSLESELMTLSKKKADQEAILVFSENLKELLMASPLGQKTILALDPGFRSGCKLVVLNAQGKLMENTVIFPHEPQRQVSQAGQTVRTLVEQYQVEAIAIGNGTAGRETEAFVSGLKLAKVAVVMVNESGASIYSASEVAREEFPDHDVTVRGAVSIGRRLADPLAELVKIDPKSIGVGQYQHDVDQSLLKSKLSEVVEIAVNKVGVDINTASKQLLTYVSGLGPVLAENIVNYRNQQGAFNSRKEISKVPRMGAKAFEQAAGFLRVNTSKNVLDRTAVHPERYGLVTQMSKDVGVPIDELVSTPHHRAKIDLKQYCTPEIGLPTLKDIIAELEKPGRDPREAFEVFSFAEGINSIQDLHEGMELTGIVTNVTNFGAFVDVGVHQDGLVHISQLADQYVSDPKSVVKVNQKVKVRVLEVEVSRKRISLSMKTR